MFETFITAADLVGYLGEEDLVLVDCRAVLGKPGAGRLLYLEGHLPGAGYADMDTDLSGARVPGQTGRHPLPEPRDLVATFERLGISNSSQVVAYDAGIGAMAAARLWWLLKWAGHDAVAVLDGGMRTWVAQGLVVEQSAVDPAPGSFVPHFRERMIASVDEVAAGELILADSRAPDRFRGENETVDPVAGHIPGAVSLPFAGNGSASGQLLAPDQLRKRFVESLDAADPDRVVFYCGSGVSAAQNVASFAHAGLGMPRLYPGSWSEWITDPSRPVSTGP